MKDFLKGFYSKNLNRVRYALRIFAIFIFALAQDYIPRLILEYKFVSEKFYPLIKDLNLFVSILMGLYLYSVFFRRANDIGHKQRFVHFGFWTVPITLVFPENSYAIGVGAAGLLVLIILGIYFCFKPGMLLSPRQKSLSRRKEAAKAEKEFRNVS